MGQQQHDRMDPGARGVKQTVSIIRQNNGPMCVGVHRSAPFGVVPINPAVIVVSATLLLDPTAWANHVYLNVNMPDASKTHPWAFK